MAKKKQCKSCKELKTVDNYYKQKDTKDGLRTICKKCWKSDNKEYYTENIDSISEANKLYSKTDKGIASRKLATKNFRHNHKDRYIAHGKLNGMVQSGKITKPVNCDICGLPSDKLDGHHEDYSKPLEVVWCCHKCHMNTYHNGE